MCFLQARERNTNEAQGYNCKRGKHIIDNKKVTWSELYYGTQGDGPYELFVPEGTQEIMRKVFPCIKI